MKKQTLRSAAGILPSALLVTSCSLEEFNYEDKVPEGKEENWTIANKNSGTLEVEEKYEKEAGLYYVDENPEGVHSIEFLPTGTYIITYMKSGYPTESTESQSAQTKTFTVNTPKGPMRVPILTGKKAETRSESGVYYQTQTGTYEHEGGVYRIYLPTNMSWTIENGKLIMSSDGRTYTVRLADQIYTGALSARLCHTWKIEKELIKVYDPNNRLIGTYQLNDNEIGDSYVAFSRYGTFLDYGYDQEYYAEAGTWNWIDQSEQRLRHRFDSDGEAFETTVYFAGNHLYMTQEADDIYDSDYFYDDYGYKALVLVCFSVVGY